MNRVLVLILGLIVLVSMIRCSSSRKIAKIPEPRKLVKNYYTDLDNIVILLYNQGGENG